MRYAKSLNFKLPCNSRLRPCLNYIMLIAVMEDPIAELFNSSAYSRAIFLMYFNCAPNMVDTCVVRPPCVSPSEAKFKHLM